MKSQVSGFDAHHAAQKAGMKKLVENYDEATGPSILVPKVGHNIKGPNDILRERIALNKKMYKETR